MVELIAKSADLLRDRIVGHHRRVCEVKIAVALSVGGNG